MIERISDLHYRFIVILINGVTPALSQFNFLESTWGKMHRLVVHFEFRISACREVEGTQIENFSSMSCALKKAAYSGPLKSVVSRCVKAWVDIALVNICFVLHQSSNSCSTGNLSAPWGLAFLFCGAVGLSSVRYTWSITNFDVGCRNNSINVQRGRQT